ncbi:MAG: hypothetical protein US15_C0023G0002 [Candidatus Moranbacteria bacterium GW2011_GWF1_36_4]|nr:MAG: hypothetical protein US15_C0023G0002 [Candidatus Moranbacteria bacterium GW2011_GWF1_36_4]
MSDFADTYAFTDRKIYNKAVRFAKKMVKDGKGDVFLPKKIWHYLIDAQRFLSLFTPESVEEIFSYASEKSPKILKSVKLPLLIVLAEEDDYKDREISKIAEWFTRELEGKNAEIFTLKGTPHNFQGFAKELEKKIKAWINKVN